MQENLDLGWQRYGTRRRKSLFALFCCGSLGLRTFLWLFSTVRFQMSSQIACLRIGIFAVVAFFWLSSTVSCKMSVQIVCLEGCKVTLAKFVWPFSSVFFKCVHKWQDQEDAKSHKMHLSDFSPFYIWVVVLFLFMNGEQMSQNMTSKMYVASLTFFILNIRY